MSQLPIRQAIEYKKVRFRFHTVILEIHPANSPPQAKRARRNRREEPNLSDLSSLRDLCVLLVCGGESTFRYHLINFYQAPLLYDYVRVSTHSGSIQELHSVCDMSASLVDVACKPDRPRDGPEGYCNPSARDTAAAALYLKT